MPRVGLVHRARINRSGAQLATDVFCHLQPMAETFPPFLDGPMNEVKGRWMIRLSPFQDVRYQDELVVTSPGVVTNASPLIVVETRPAPTHRGYMTVIAVQNEYEPVARIRVFVYAGEELTYNGLQMVSDL